MTDERESHTFLSHELKSDLDLISNRKKYQVKESHRFGGKGEGPISFINSIRGFENSFAYRSADFQGQVIKGRVYCASLRCYTTGSTNLFFFGPVLSDAPCSKRMERLSEDQSR